MELGCRLAHWFHGTDQGRSNCGLGRSHNCQFDWNPPPGAAGGADAFLERKLQPSPEKILSVSQELHHQQGVRECKTVIFSPGVKFNLVISLSTKNWTEA